MRSSASIPITTVYPTALSLSQMLEARMTVTMNANYWSELLSVTFTGKC